MKSRIFFLPAVLIFVGPAFEQDTKSATDLAVHRLPCRTVALNCAPVQSYELRFFIRSHVFARPKVQARFLR